MLVAESLLAALRKEHRPPGDSATRRTLNGVLALSKCSSLTPEQVELTGCFRLPQFKLAPLLALKINLAWAHLSNGDTALALKVIDDVIRLASVVFYEEDGENSLREVFRLCSAIGDPGRIFNIPHGGWLSEFHYVDFVSCFAERGMWSECLQTARGLPSLRQRNLALLALAGWYYILQPDTGEKQTAFLSKLIKLSEKQYHWLTRPIGIFSC